MSDNIIQINKDLIHAELKDLVKNSVEETLNALLDAKADKLVNTERYARDEEQQGYRALLPQCNECSSKLRQRL